MTVRRLTAANATHGGAEYTPFRIDYTANSHDDMPSGVLENSLLLEVDTGLAWLFRNGAWHPPIAGGAGDVSDPLTIGVVNVTDHIAVDGVNLTPSGIQYKEVPLTDTDIKNLGLQAGFDIVKRARWDLGVTARKVGFGKAGYWEWTLRGSTIDGPLRGSTSAREAAEETVSDSESAKRFTYSRSKFEPLSSLNLFDEELRGSVVNKVERELLSTDVFYCWQCPLGATPLAAMDKGEGQEAKP